MTPDELDQIVGLCAVIGFSCLFAAVGIVLGHFMRKFIWHGQVREYARKQESE